MIIKRWTVIYFLNNLKLPLLWEYNYINTILDYDDLGLCGFFWLYCLTYGISVPRPGIEPQLTGPLGNSQPFFFFNMWIEFSSYMKAIQGTVDNLKGKSIQYRMSQIYTTSEIAIICSVMYSFGLFLWMCYKYCFKIRMMSYKFMIYL